MTDCSNGGQGPEIAVHQTNTKFFAFQPVFQ